MNFRDLQETIARLANDPRIHPNTRVEIAYEYEREDCTNDGRLLSTGTVHEQEPLVAITLNGSLTLSTHRSEPAVAR